MEQHNRFIVVEQLDNKGKAVINPEFIVAMRTVQEHTVIDIWAGKRSGCTISVSTPENASSLLYRIQMETGKHVTVDGEQSGLPYGIPDEYGYEALADHDNRLQEAVEAEAKIIVARAEMIAAKIETVHAKAETIVAQEKYAAALTAVILRGYRIDKTPRAPV